MKLQDLKRGMRCTRRSGLQYIVDETEIEEGAAHYTLHSKSFGEPGGLNEDLAHSRFSSLDIVKVEDITLDGYKTIWEREDERYYLELPNSWYEDRYLNYNISSKLWHFSGKKGTHRWQTQFTQEEIDQLPHQDFIKTLIKEEVK